MFADGIWAVNPDGTGLTELFAAGEQLFIRPRDFGAAVSPTDGYLAFITASDQQFRGLTLNLLKLPAGEFTVITSLSSPDTEPEVGSDPAIRPPESLLAIATEASLAWSPDGRQLAFMGAFESPSSDLYIYSLEDGSITRLTDGPSEGIQPSWSPDGKNILHFGVTTLGTGAGYEMAGVWAAKADNSGVVTLYEPDEDSGGEVLLGWTADDTFAVFTVDVSAGGSSDLRTVNVDTGAVNVAWEGLFHDAALDPDSGSLLVLSNDITAAANPDLNQGLYLISPGFTSPVRILEDDPHGATWSVAAGLFFAKTEFGVVAITRNGDWNQVHDFTGNLPIANPLERELTWYGPAGMWVGNLISSIDGPQPEQVFAKSVSHAAWAPGGQSVLFFSDDGIHVGASR
jgi:WD40 repeat protein